MTTAVRSDGMLEEIKKGLYFGGDRPTPEVPHKWLVLCYDLATGQQLWERTAHEGVPAQGHHLKNTLASETPVTDGERLYVYFGNVGLFCYTLDGEPVWSKPVEPRKMAHGWGTAASPVLLGDRLIIVNDNEENSYLAAYDTATGDEIWKVERDEESNWATPFVWRNDARTEIVTPGANRVRSYSVDGEQLWELGGMSSIAIPTPFEANGLLYVSSGYVLDDKKPVFAIKPGASGDISLAEKATQNDSIVWFRNDAGPYNPSPLVFDGRMYVLYDRGFFACYDATTGEEVYGKQRLGGAFTASPWVVGDRIYCLNEDGLTTAIQTGPEFKIVAENDLKEFCMATPAIVDGALLIRTETKLHRIGGSN